MTGAFQGLFALMNRSLRTEDRSIRTHLNRLLYILLSYGMLIGAQSSGRWMGAPGLNMFRYICFLNFFCIILAAMSFFAVAITEEKEEMTLGLLKMAGVSSLALLIGKSAPRLIAALVLLTAQLPFTMLAITLGGVSLHQVLAAYFCLFAFLVFLANMGLFLSVISLRSRTAGMLTGLSLFSYFFGPWIFQGIRAGLMRKGWWTAGTWLDTALVDVSGTIVSSSAFVRIQTILQTGFSESAFSFQVGSNLFFGLVFLGLGWLVFERCTRNEQPASESRGLLVRRIGARSSLIGAGRAWDLSLIWKDFYFVCGGKVMLLLKFLAYSAILGLIVWFGNQNGSNIGMKDFGGIAMYLGIFVLVIETAIQASRVFYTEAKWKTLSSLMLLPKGVAQIAYTKIAGSAISLIPATCVFLLGMLCAPKLFTTVVSEMVDEPTAWYSVSQVVLFIHVTALLSVYLKWGALPLAFALVYGMNVVCMFFLSALFMFNGPSDTGLFALIAFGTYVLCGVIHILVGARLKYLAAS